MIVLLIMHRFVAGMSNDSIMTLFRPLTSNTFHRVLVRYIQEQRLTTLDMSDEPAPRLDDPSGMLNGIRHRLHSEPD